MTGYEHKRYPYFSCVAGVPTNYRSTMPLELVHPPIVRPVRDAGQIVAVKADNGNGKWGMELLQVVMQNILR